MSPLLVYAMSVGPKTLIIRFYLLIKMGGTSTAHAIFYDD